MEAGHVEAVAINATNLTTGNHELFLHKNDALPYMGEYICHLGPIQYQHVLASAAIPFIFQPIEIKKHYYADGGLKLFTPMSPAIQLGADKLLIISLRKRDVSKEKIDPDAQVSSPPTLAHQMGGLLNGLFIDRIEYDLKQLDRINRLIHANEQVFGKEALKQINKAMQKRKGSTIQNERPLRNVGALEIQPSQSISNLFNRWYERAGRNEFKLSVLEKLLIRILEIDPSGGSNLLSYITFSHEYLKELFELGYQDAQGYRNQLIDLMQG